MIMLQWDLEKMEVVGGRVRRQNAPPKTFPEHQDMLLREVQGAPHTSSSTIEDVRIDHRRIDVSVPQQLLDGTDIIPFL